MTSPDPVPARPDDTGAPLATSIAVLAPPAAFVVPFIGPLAATAITITLAATLGVVVWPVRRRTSVLAGLAVLGAIVVVLGVVGVAGGMTEVLAFQLIPLCGPDPGTPWIVAAVVAGLGYGGVAVISVRTGRIWLWPVAAAVGAGLYLATWAIAETSLDVSWIC